MRRLLSIALLVLVSGGCKGLLGIDDVTFQDAVIADAAGESDALVDGAPDAAVDASVDNCPVAYGAFGAGRYRIATQTVAWSTAASACAADTPGGANTHLVVVGSEAERDLLASMAPNVRLWIGLSKRSGSLAWVTAEPAPIVQEGTPPWAPGEPDGAAQACVFIENGLLSDDSCGNGRRFICECDDFADDPTRY